MSTSSSMRNNARNVKDKGRKDKGGDRDKPREKKFDKKKYRLQKYSNKYKINQWEERRKKAVLRGFYKELGKSQQISGEASLGSNSKNGDEASASRHKGSAFFKAKREYRRKQEEAKKRREDAARVKAEREEALRNYKEKRMRNFKLLSKKTSKGQPVMKGRVEMLLERIQRNVD
ncbi:PREDICTED: thyroid transcription factor 1-associated protein 26 homolog [Vollenhovia emeryi]|uniref:thyroid transcription factor 1-associated protein 26 homolog n=1 Tax=Vollenhovia emeryi TaxID=411798 RepID=UPI0005F39860|nr:PREDICTED: thyroid transcription factor 1-associated protein 26 homolog [Vollenhovia emeryi]